MCSAHDIAYLSVAFAIRGGLLSIQSKYCNCIWDFHHFAYMLCQFCQIYSCPSRIRQLPNHSLQNVVIDLTEHPVECVRPLSKIYAHITTFSLAPALTSLSHSRTYSYGSSASAAMKFSCLRRCRLQSLQLTDNIMALHCYSKGKERPKKEATPYPSSLVIARNTRSGYSQ